MTRLILGYTILISLILIKQLTPSSAFAQGPVGGIAMTSTPTPPPSGSGASGGSSSSSCVVTQVGQPGEDVEKPTCSSLSTPGGGLPGQPLPSQDIDVIKEKLCNDYRVCPTVNTTNAPAGGDWSLNSLTALWNVVQRMYESPTYVKHAIGDRTLEISRVSSHPGDGGWAWGVHAGLGTPDYHTLPNSRLIVITNRAFTSDSSVGYWEWLLAHEIAHAASWGRDDGLIGEYPGDNNFTYNAVVNCGTEVSGYGLGSSDENYADTVSYYMTTGEEVTDYEGSGAKNIKSDFPCVYNALKEGYFDNKEF